MILLNFAHPFTPQQQADIEQMVGNPVTERLDARVQFDLEQPFVAQAVALLDTLAVPPARWQTETWLVALPSLNYIAAVLLAELHGRMGHFPTIVRLRPVQGKLVTEYEIAEIISLEQARQQARTRR